MKIWEQVQSLRYFCFMDQNFDMLAKCLYGFEAVLAKELRDLGAQNVKEGVRSVSFKGDKGFMYKANLSLRTALRILVPVFEVDVSSDEDLYRKLLRHDWGRYLDVSGTLAVNATVFGDTFKHSHYVALRTKDAIVDYFRKKEHKRPNVDVRHPDVLFHVHIHNQKCIVSLDSSGESLHKRGYRSETNIAPINEVLAAGLILMSGYSGSVDFIDPMCGSGTLLIEAAMIACNIPAGIHRAEFGFEKWKDFDPDLFELIHGSMLKRVRNASHKIIGFDKAPSAIRKSTENIKHASLEEFIGVERKNFFHEPKPVEGDALLLFNPPYGERLNIDVEDFYRNIGDALKNNYLQTTAWIISSDFEKGIKSIGLRSSRRIKVFNGKLECRFVKYEMYAGSKKQ
jgi:putative N6-adenine-specific DNA methylase